MTLTFGSLFAGIGGFDLGLERAGMVCKWQVEIDPFCQKVLAKHWPDVERFGDVRKVGEHNLSAVDLIAGGFPCQPFSAAGQRRGEQDDRNLWPEMRRVVAELRPCWVVAENVPGIRNLYLDTVLSDLEGLDYTAGTVDLPAVAFGAPHIRHRLFIVAYANGPAQRRGQQPERGAHQRNPQPSRNGAKGGAGFVADTESEHDGYVDNGISAIVRHTAHKDEERGRSFSDPACWVSEPDVGRVVDGLPSELDKHRLAALGNAVVPQVAEWLGRRIMEVENR